ncbi:type II secretion system F family protein [Planctomycetota bacterium]
MATFQYNALTSSGRLMKGTIEAGSQDEAGELLKQMQLSINSIEIAKPEKPKTSIGRNEFMLFNQQLVSITKAGIPLEKGLRELSRDVSSRSMRTLITEIADELEAGVSIEKAFEKRQKHFPPLYGRILKAGVETGRLSEMLTSLNRHLDMANQTRRIVFEAISYPIVILVLAAIIITCEFLFIIPSFTTAIYEMTDGAQLPALTRFFLNIPPNLIPFWIITGLIIAIFFAISKLLSTSASGRRFRESFFLNLPVIGRVYKNSLFSRLSETMAIAITSGCDIPEALRLSSGATGSPNLMQECEIVAAEIEQGTGILEAGQLCRFLPRLFLYSIQLGAQRNEILDNLYSMGQMYSEHTRYDQSRMQAILLPGMLIFIGLFIAMSIVGIFAPMISIITNLSS